VKSKVLSSVSLTRLNAAIALNLALTSTMLRTLRFTSLARAIGYESSYPQRGLLIAFSRGGLNIRHSQLQSALPAKTVADQETSSLATDSTEAATLQEATLKKKLLCFCLLRLDLCVGNLLTCCQTRQDKAEKKMFAASRKKLEILEVTKMIFIFSIISFQGHFDCFSEVALV
jgi:hypothetical protein